MDMAHSPGAISRSLKAVGPVSNAPARLPLASTSHSSVRAPWEAASWPSAAAIAVLPTPPLPVTNSSLRSSRPEGIGSAAEPDAPPLVARPDLDVRHLVDGDAVLAAAPVGQPQRPPLRERRVDVPAHGVPVGVLGRHHLELLGRALDPDADVHCFLLCQAGVMVGGGPRHLRPEPPQARSRGRPPPPTGGGGPGPRPGTPGR